MEAVLQPQLLTALRLFGKGQWLRPPRCIPTCHGMTLETHFLRVNLYGRLRQIRFSLTFQIAGRRSSILNLRFERLFCQQHLSHAIQFRLGVPPFNTMPVQQRIEALAVVMFS